MLSKHFSPTAIDSIENVLKQDEFFEGMTDADFINQLSELDDAEFEALCKAQGIDDPDDANYCYRQSGSVLIWNYGSL